MEKPLVSILIPVYNASVDVKTTLMSCLNQNYLNFEIVVINDGSDDNTVNFINEINDDRIKLYNKIHNGISEALNFGLKKCNGEFIARFDGNEIMDENRLSIQVEYMLNNSDCDVLTTNLWAFKNNQYLFAYTMDSCVITKDELMQWNSVAHPTIMFRKKSLEKLPFIYEQYYDGCEDYRLWFHCIDNGLKIHRINYKSIIWFTEKLEHENVNKLTRRMKNLYLENQGELTCIVITHNEYVEALKTILSIKGTTKNTNILLIDDYSNDGLNYEEMCKNNNVRYIRTNNFLGNAKCKDFGVDLCETEYFTIIECGARFYDDDWDEKILCYLKKDNNILLCPKISEIKYINGEYFNENNKNKMMVNYNGGYVDFCKNDTLISSKYIKSNFNSNLDLEEVTCINSDLFATSKKWWNTINGLKFFDGDGYEDIFLSIKNYMLGGKNILCKNWNCGKVSKNKKYNMYNYFILIWFFFTEEKYEYYVNNLKEYISKEEYINIISKFRLNSLHLIEYLDSFNHSIVNTIDKFIEQNASYLYMVNKNV